jgi:hypothetical protein
MVGKEQLWPLKRVVIPNSEIDPQKQTTTAAEGRVENDLTVWSGDYVRAVVEHRSH